MSNFFPPEDLLREHHREVRALAARARLLELARCCKPSRLSAALGRMRELARPSAPCCA